jgi:tetratricopeptide (TPR) repeat protein
LERRFPLGPKGEGVFAPGELVAGRYRVVRFVAHGGFGEVYEVEDRDLGERLALKTLRRHVANDPRVSERFRREIHLARQVTHPNVCRVFDLGHHHPGGDPAAEIPFLTMELLEGETLSDRLRRDGPLAPDAALPVARQIAAALAAAHAAGVVHRDLKTSNVILVPGPGDERAVVTDFGIARESEAGDLLASLTAGEPIGTPLFMAPEQVEGGPITPATDLYAFGVVLYAMLTGRFPFEGESAFSIAVKRLKEPPQPPHSHVSDLDPRWETVILRCLERDPADRFGSALEVERALTGAAVPLGRRLRRRRWLAGGVAAAVLLAGWATLGVLHRRASSPLERERVPAPATKARQGVAVLGFNNLNRQAEVDWLATALTEMLTTELAAGGRLRAIPGEAVARSRRELGLHDLRTFDRATLDRIHGNLGADLVVMGTYLAVAGEGGRHLRVDVRVQPTTGERETLTLAAEGKEANLIGLVDELGARLRGALAMQPLTAAEAGEVHAALPAGSEAARLYAEGLARLRVFDATAARELLERAVAAEPANALLHSALADAWTALGYDARAEEEAKRALDLAGELSRQERLAIEARYREAAGQWEKATAIHAVLWRYFPDNLDYGLRLGAAQVRAGNGKAALATLDQLRRLPPPAGDDPRIDLAEAAAAESISEPERQLQAVLRAAEKGKRRGALLVVAEARLAEARVRYQRGEGEASRAACEEATRLFELAGDRRGVANVRTVLGSQDWQEGDFARAREEFQQALGIFRELGDKADEGRALNNLAAVSYMRGDLPEARRRFEETRAIFHELRLRGPEAKALNNLASILKDQGELAQASELFRQSIAIKREMGDARGVAHSLNGLGDILRSRGDLAGARSTQEQAVGALRELGDKNALAGALGGLGDAQLALGDLAATARSYEEALALARPLGNRHAAAAALFGLGDVALARGDLAEAQARHRESLGLRRELDEQEAAAASRLALARVALAGGRVEAAQEQARQSLAAAAKAGSVLRQGEALAVLARAASEQQRWDDARAALQQARRLRAGERDEWLRSTLDLLDAHLAGHAGDAAAARGTLREVLHRTQSAGFAELGLEARLAVAELGLGAGDPAARASLQALAGDARARGFALLARRAEALAAGG